MSDDLAPCRIGRSLHGLAELPPLAHEVFESPPFPRAFPSAVHPPTSFDPPPESYEPVPTACRFRLGGSSHEVSAPHRAISIPGPPSRWVPSHRRRPPSGFRNLSAVCSPVHLAGLFHPAGTSRLPLQGFSLPRSRCGSSPPPCPLAVTACGAPLARRPTRSPTSGPCSPGESVAHGPRLSEPPARSPPGLHPLQGFPHPDP